MLTRFCLYGFLKNQRYYEPFLILALLDKGLSYFLIGILIGYREVCINVLEIPSGAISDVWGRRKSMILSFVAYIGAFALFALSRRFTHFVAAMSLFAVGEAFRTGTHKAMIFHWLRKHGREEDTTVVYGLTRSWSKRGSAISVLIAAVLVVTCADYSAVFWFSIAPYLVGIVNFLGYPAYLDACSADTHSEAGFLSLLRASFSRIIHVRSLRGLLAESMVHEGTYKTVKDYIQPLLKQVALALPWLALWPEHKRAAILVGAVYFCLHALSSWASQNAHRVSSRYGGEKRASRRVWTVELASYLLLIPVLASGNSAAAVAVFVVLAVMQNVWMPMYLKRLNAVTEQHMAATILSVDSQARSLLAAIAAPLLGLAVDRMGFWTIGVAGALAAGAALAAGFHRD